MCQVMSCVLSKCYLVECPHQPDVVSAVTDRTAWSSSDLGCVTEIGRYWPKRGDGRKPSRERNYVHKVRESWTSKGCGRTGRRGEERTEEPCDGYVRSRWVWPDQGRGGRTCRITQWPFLAARSSAASATTSCPCPRDTLWKFLLLKVYPSFLPERGMELSLLPLVSTICVGLCS